MEPYREESIEALAHKAAESLKGYVDERVDERVKIAEKQLAGTPRPLSTTVLGWRLGVLALVLSLAVAGACTATTLHGQATDVLVARAKAEEKAHEAEEKAHEVELGWQHAKDQSAKEAPKGDAK